MNASTTYPASAANASTPSARNKTPTISIGDLLNMIDERDEMINELLNTIALLDKRLTEIDSDH